MLNICVCFDEWMDRGPSAIYRTENENKFATKTLYYTYNIAERQIDGEKFSRME